VREDAASEPNSWRKLCWWQAVALDVEDLELEATPEDLMLSYVSGDKDKVCSGVAAQPMVQALNAARHSMRPPLRAAPH
jgi:hypothetical protein